MSNYITIEEVNGERLDKVRQTLRFQTGNFVWRIKFNVLLRASTVNNQTCFVTATSGEPLATKIHYNSEQRYIEIEPVFAYAKNQSYILHITTKVASLKGQTLQQEIRIRFKI